MVGEVGVRVRVMAMFRFSAGRSLNCGLNCGLPDADLMLISRHACLTLVENSKTRSTLFIWASVSLPEVQRPVIHNQ